MKAGADLLLFSAARVEARARLAGVMKAFSL
jgi:hypothetical protein